MKQHNMQNYKEILVDQDNKFQLYILQPIYREITCSNGAFLRNTKTGENCGRRVFLCVYKFNNDGTKRDKFEYEEDCYESVVEEVVNE